MAMSITMNLSVMTSKECMTADCNTIHTQIKSTKMAMTVAILDVQIQMMAVNAKFQTLIA